MDYQLIKGFSYLDMKTQSCEKCRGAQLNVHMSYESAQ